MQECHPSTFIHHVCLLCEFLENESELEELDPKSKRRLPLAVRSGGDGNSNEEEDIKKAEAESKSFQSFHQSSHSLLTLATTYSTVGLPVPIRTAEIVLSFKMSLNMYLFYIMQLVFPITL